MTNGTYWDVNAPWLRAHVVLGDISKPLDERVNEAYAILGEALWPDIASAPSAAQSPPAPSGWQPIESAPKDGREVLLTDGRWKRTGYWARRIEKWSVDTAVALNAPTHWMPLPPDPTQEPTS